MKDGQHGGGGGFINEPGHKVAQGHAVAGEFDLIRHMHLQQSDGIAVWQLNAADLLGAGNVIAFGDDGLWGLEKLERAAGQDVFQNGAVGVPGVRLP
ncbi:MAG: hypothetical protein NTY98_08855 [Verrucomicrobia bacterium]|nr:hypothetical protein [Verrucomicrobiota bacterium]